jgi:hypothetical protein
LKNGVSKYLVEVEVPGIVEEEIIVDISISSFAQLEQRNLLHLKSSNERK